MSGTQQALLMAGGIAGDPHFASVVSLMHYDGTNGTQVFTDEKSKVWTPLPSRQSWTFVGNAQLDTAQSVFGGASLLLDGTGDYLFTGDSADFELGSGDFTIEAAVRLAAVGVGGMTICSKYTATGSQRAFILSLDTTANTLTWQYSTGGGAPSSLSVSFTWAANTWYRVAISRTGATWYLFVDGTSLTSGTSATIFNSTAPLRIGAFDSGGLTVFFNGWIDEFRLTKGVGRYTANYTVSAAAFPNSVSADASYASVTSLMHFDGTDAATTADDSAGQQGLDTATKLFGTASLASATGYLQSPDHTDFRVGAGDFTIEAAIRSTNLGTSQAICSKYVAGGDQRSYIFSINAGGSALLFAYDLNGTGIDETVSGSFSFSTNTWYKVAVSRVGTTIYLFVDGALVGSSATIGSGTIFAATFAPVVIGGQNSTGSVDQFIVGNLEEFRFTKGTGRYTATYTPQSAAFQNF